MSLYADVPHRKLHLIRNTNHLVATFYALLRLLNL